MDGVDLKVNEGEIVGLIGPNGAGKTTLFNIVSGRIKPTMGKVKFGGKDITGVRAHKITSEGLCRTFQNSRSFHSMTVFENVLAASMFGRNKFKTVRECREMSEEILEFTQLSRRKTVQARELNIIDLRRLEIARSLATGPRMLLLDETMAGLNQSELLEATKMVESIRTIRKVTVLLVEHIMKAITTMSDRVIVLDHGKKIADGNVGDVLNSEIVVQAYLGTEGLTDLASSGSQ